LSGGRPTTIFSAWTRPNKPLESRRSLKWSTPGRIRALAAVCLVATIIVFAVTATSLSSVRSGVAVIGHRTSPEVVSASGVYFALNDMDAQVANILLVADQNLGGSRQDLVKLYEADRLTVDHNLQQIAALAAKDPASQQQVQAVLDGLGAFSSWLPWKAWPAIKSDTVKPIPAIAPAPESATQPIGGRNRLPPSLVTSNDPASTPIGLPTTEPIKIPSVMGEVKAVARKRPLIGVPALARANGGTMK
jgi:hypothetical protein